MVSRTATPAPAAPGRAATPAGVPSTVYLFPWDVSDGRSADAVASLGAGSATLAAAYHAVRAVSPRHPRRRLVVSDRTRVYTRHQPGDGLLAPPDGTEATGEPDSFGRARDLLQERGVPVRAWLVLNHVDGLAGPDGVHRRSALGEVHRFALCPAQQPVLDRAAALIGSVLRAAAVDGVVLEAVGAMSAVHASEHDKTGLGPSSPELTGILSFCFCAGCRASLRSSDVDDQALGDAVSRLVLRGDDAAAFALLDAEGVRRHTAAVAERALVTAVRAAVDAGARDVSVHATALPTDGGPAVGVGDRVPAAAVTAAGAAALRLVASCWVPPEQARARVRALRAASPGLAVGAFVDVLRATDARALAEEWRGLLDAGADELHVYHAGLATTAVLGHLRAALVELRPSPQPPAKEDR